MTKERLEEIIENLNRRNLINVACGNKTSQTDNEIMELIDYIQDLDEKINKAMEYMKHNATSNYFDEEKNMFRREIDLLEILKGSNND